MKKVEITCDKCGGEMRGGDYVLDYGSAFTPAGIMGNNNFPPGGFDLCSKCFLVVARKIKELIKPTL